MKNKETIEEAAERLYPTNIILDYDTNEDIRMIWTDGAKWQAERMYSEEDLRKAILTSFLLGVDRGIYSKEKEDKIIEQFKKK
jgi:hypothetical protein